MAISDLKMKDADFTGKQVTDLSDNPSEDGVSATDLKEMFVAPSKRVVLPAFNALIELLAGSEGAANIGATQISGLSGYTVQDILEAIKALLDTKKPTETVDKELAQKFDKKEAQALVKNIEFNESNGIFTITKYDGTVQTYDTALEKVALNVRLEGQQFVLTLVDGTEQRVDLSAFLTQTEVKNSNTITLAITNGVISAQLVAGSVTMAHLNPEVTEYIDGKEASATASATEAGVQAENARLSAVSAEASKNAAKISEGNAKNSEQGAKESEGNAKTSETNSKTSETNAKTSETNAAESAKQAQEAVKETKTNAEAVKRADEAAEAAEKAISSIEEAVNSANTAAESANDAANEIMTAKEIGAFDGTSVTVKNVSESTEDGGSNVVTFSDGKTVTIKNGNKGATGKTAYQYATENGYTGTEVEFGIKLGKDIPSVAQGAGQSESLVMSQKAVTDLVAEALGTEETEYETVTSVEQMTDTSKQYVMNGTVWAYGEFTETTEAPNKFVPSAATLNQRLSGSSGSVSANSGSVGSLITDFIPVSKMDSVSPYYARLNWEIQPIDENKAVFYNSSKTRIGNTVYSKGGGGQTISNGETAINVKYIHTNSSVEPSWADVAYVRFQLFVKPSGTSLTSDDVADLQITFDADAGTTTEHRWYDTGYTPEDASGSGNYVEMAVKINQNTSDIKEVSNRVTKLETGSDSVTIPSFWQDAVDICVSKIKALQVGRHCITFPFFSDNHTRNGYAGMLIAHIMNECKIPYCFYGGDSISSGYIDSEETMIAQDKAFDTSMSYVPNGRFCRAVGNHDGYWAVSASEKHYYTREQVYELFLREESIAQNKHFGDDGTYYYVNDIASKTRFIVLNTNGGSMDSVQITWLQNTALSFNESGWAVVLICHQPLSNHYHANISNAAEVRTVIANHINGTDANKADIVGCFSGHIHRDRIWSGEAVNTTDDSEGEAMPFKQVTITSDHTSIAYDDATKHTVANDDKSHAIDFVTVNKKTRTVTLTRLGIGEDRSYTY